MSRSVVSVSGVSGLSMCVGLVENMLIAAFIGATYVKDAYDTAALIPRTLMTVAGISVLKGVATNVFSQVDVFRYEHPSRAYASIVNALLVIGIVIAVLGMLLAEYAVKMLGPGLDEASTVLAIRLARYILPMLPLIAMVTVLDSILLAYHYYASTQAIEMLPKFCVAIALLLAGQQLHVWSLVLGTYVGLLMQLAILVVLLHRQGLRYSIALDGKSLVLRRMLSASGPLLLAVVFYHILTVVLQRGASYGPIGTIASYNYALFICAPIATLLSVPLAKTIAPRISRATAEHNYARSRQLLRKSLAVMGLSSVAFIALLWAQAENIVTVLLRRGNFSVEAVTSTSQFAAVMGLAVLPIGMRMVAIRVLLAYRRAGAVGVFSVLAMSSGALVVHAGLPWWGVVAVPVAYVAANTVDGVLCTGLAVRVAGPLGYWPSRRQVLRWLLALAAVGSVPFIPTLPWLGWQSAAQPLVSVLLSGMLSAGALTIAAVMVGLLKWRGMWSRVRARPQRRN